MAKHLTNETVRKKRSRRSRPISPEFLQELKEQLTILGKMGLADWSYLILGIGGGLRSDDWNNTITISQLFDILTYNIPTKEYEAVLSNREVTRKGN